MPQRVTWDPALATGDASTDAAHQALLALCDELADRCASGDDTAFDATWARLREQARTHLQAEHADEQCEEFDYLVGEIALPVHFDRVELQRFVALWCLGHVREAVAR